MTGEWSDDVSGTVTGVFAAALERCPDRVFLDFGGSLFTYADIEHRSNRQANGLADLGVGRGSTVASLLNNSVDAVATWLAVNKLGAIHVPVNTALIGDFLAHQLADCGSSVLLVDDDLVERVDPILPALEQIRFVVGRGAVPTVPGRGCLQIDDLLAGSEAPLADHNEPRTIGTLMYTSGTTGRSKGCMLPQNATCHVARTMIENTGRRPDELLWSPLPLFHQYAAAVVVVSTAMLGSTAAVADHFSVSRFWPEIRRTGAGLAGLMGSMIPLIAQAPDTDDSRACFGQLRHVDGAPFPAEMQSAWRERFGITTAGVNVYGMTEAAPVTCIKAGTAYPAGSSGRRYEAFDVRIVDEEGRDLPDGSPGEVVVRPLRPHVMFKGYWGDPEATIAMSDDLWFHMGDVGRFDAEGFFWFVDRKKDYLRRGGENISSVEVERCLLAHPGLAEVAVHAVASDLAEDDVKVSAVLAVGSSLTEHELCRWSAERLPFFAVPRYVEFRPSLPKNAVGRVLKAQLRAEGCTSATWDRDTTGALVEH